VSFAFSARHDKEASGPSGNAVMVMPGKIFHSTSYESLVVSGSRAQLQGRGRLNGCAGYAFLLSVVDGPGRHGQDTIRIRIWNEHRGGHGLRQPAGRSDGCRPDRAGPIRLYPRPHALRS